MNKNRLKLVGGGLIAGAAIVTYLLVFGIAAPRGVTDIATAFKQRQSEVDVEAWGRVVRVMPDDLKGARHQRLIVELEDGLTVLLAHNIDIAPRVEPIYSGSMIGFKGEYEWNENGGAVHWTHRDPSGQRSGGWLEYQGLRYR